MTAAWSEQLPDRSANDRKAWISFGLALVGGAAVLGSVAGAALGFARTCWCCWDVENEEPCQ